jgi:hypothetical protein
MKLIKRCYGCGGIIWLWQDGYVSKTVGYVHKKCLGPAHIRKVFGDRYIDRTEHLRQKQKARASDSLSMKKN